MDTMLLIVAGGLTLMIIVVFFFLKSKVKDVDDKANVLNARMGQILNGGIMPQDSSGSPIYVTGRRPQSSMGGQPDYMEAPQMRPTRISPGEPMGGGSAAPPQQPAIPSRTDRLMGMMGGLMGQIPTFMGSAPTEEDILDVSDADEGEEEVPPPKRETKKKATR